MSWQFIAIFVIFFAISVIETSAAEKGYVNNSPEWKQFSESSAFIWSYDNQSIEHSGTGKAIVWAKAIAKGQTGINEKIRLLRKFGGRPLGYEAYAFTINLFEIDCEKRKLRVLSVKDYNKKGDLLESVSLDGSPWDIIPPGSVINNLYAIVCK
jgi:hypothetical protein